jgi:hypothetical protein
MTTYGRFPAYRDANDKALRWASSEPSSKSGEDRANWRDDYGEGCDQIAGILDGARARRPPDETSLAPSATVPNKKPGVTVSILSYY